MLAHPYGYPKAHGYFEHFFFLGGVREAMVSWDHRLKNSR